jgi:hypothetical protein
VLSLETHEMTATNCTSGQCAKLADIDPGGPGPISLLIWQVSRRPRGIRLSWCDRAPWWLLLVVMMLLPLEVQAAGELPRCDEPPYVQVHLGTRGLPIAGLSVQLDARDAKIVVIRQNCTMFARPLRSWRWALISRPPTSISTIAGASLLPTLRLDVPGAYTVRFTACPGGCDSVPEDSFEAVISATSQATIPPETVPFPPPSANQVRNALSDDAARKCDDGGGLVDPEWVTVNEWLGPQDYQLAEGWVTNSHVGTQDNLLNHVFHDADFLLDLDSTFHGLLREFGIVQPRQYELDVEWERNQLREVYWPTSGDRVSAFGYWIHDCGHDPYDTEIHPPVGVAVQRVRPIQIPANLTFPFFRSGPCPEPPCRPFVTGVGNNVYVPGVVTDILFNKGGGRLKDCLATSLHQPEDQSGNEGACISGPSPINRQFEFNIYLPRDPRAVYKQGGRDVPPVPLYAQVLPGSPSQGPEPSIEIKKEGDVTYLHVVLNLTDFGGDLYNRRIVAAWVYPSPDNWGLSRWRVRVDSINVHDSGRGNWGFWVHINNTHQEWTRFMDCTSCINDGLLTTTGEVGPAPWETDGVLGPDILAFSLPGQQLLIHATGYDDDPGLFGLRAANIGVVYDSRPMAPGTFSTRSCCGDSSRYTLNYEILAHPPTSRPSLSPAAQSLYDAYQLTASTGGNAPVPIAVPVKDAAHMVLEPNQPTVELNEIPPFRPQEIEQNALMTGAGVVELKKAVLKNNKPGRVEKVTSLISAIRKRFDDGLGSPVRRQYLLIVPGQFRILKQGLPKGMFDEKLSSLGPILKISGDVNGDGVVDDDDISRLDEAIAGIKPLNTTEFERTDMSGQCGDKSSNNLVQDRQVLVAFVKAMKVYDSTLAEKTKPNAVEVKDQCHKDKLVGQALTN